MKLKSSMESYDIIDTDTCSCCSDLKHERKIKTVGSLLEAADYLASSHDNNQLLEGLFDDIVIKNRSSTYSASECLKVVGYNKQVLDGMKKKKRTEVLKWLNLPPSSNFNF